MEMKKDNQTCKEDIEEMYYLLKAFDKFCDVLREEFIYVIENANFTEEEIVETKTVKNVIVE